MLPESSCQQRDRAAAWQNWPPIWHDAQLGGLSDAQARDSQTSKQTHRGRGGQKHPWRHHGAQNQMVVVLAAKMSTCLWHACMQALLVFTLHAGLILRHTPITDIWSNAPWSINASGFSDLRALYVTAGKKGQGHIAPKLIPDDPKLIPDRSRIVPINVKNKAKKQLNSYSK